MTAGPGGILVSSAEYIVVSVLFSGLLHPFFVIEPCPRVQALTILIFGTGILHPIAQAQVETVCAMPFMLC